MDATLTGDAAAPASQESGARRQGVALDDEHLTASRHPALDAVGDVDVDDLVDPGLLADLEDPNLVLSDDYVGSDRRATGPRAWLRRTTFVPRRSILRVELVVASALAVAVVSVLFAGSNGPRAAAARDTAPARSVTAPDAVNFLPALTTPATTPTTAVRAPTTPTTAAPAAAATPTTPATTPATTPTTAAPAAAVPAAAPAATVPTTTPSAADLTPAQLGAEALTLVRYPWQRIPGYTIQFLPISDAPSPGYYGNTTFTWGHTGGTSVLYVYAGETVQRLAAITAFEIGHEVDAAAVEPQGGETQIENVLGIHPASWAPDCDCAEQGFLSGWYAAAFSNYWSPGVGTFSTLAAEPTGSVLAEVAPWLNPTIS
jgi:hypothetical protein